MQIGVIPENPLERLALWANLVPVPLIDTQIAFTKAYVIQVGVKLHVFEALAEGALSSEEVAEELKLNPTGTAKLMNALAGIGYLKVKGNRYRIHRKMRKWLLKDSPQSFYHKILLHFTEWHWVEHFTHYVQTGEPQEMHDHMDKEEWATYQRGMRNLAGAGAKEVVMRLSFPNGATQLLDIGGSHGYYSVLFCKKYPALHATILDLPQAIDEAGKILEKENPEGRVQHLPGNALTTNLGENNYDVVFVANLVHHFTAEENQQLVNRICTSLKPGGKLVILELVKANNPEQAARNGGGALMDLYFASTSRSGIWSVKEMHGWMKNAHLRPVKSTWLRTMPGAALVSGLKQI